MTLSMITKTPVYLSAHSFNSELLQLGIGTTYVHLNVDEVQKLRDYLDGFIAKSSAENTGE